jgi:hypothetical protein
MMTYSFRTQKRQDKTYRYMIFIHTGDNHMRYLCEDGGFKNRAQATIGAKSRMHDIRNQSQGK